MRRKLFTVLAAISLLLCVATIGLWVRSTWATQSVKWFGTDIGFVLGSGNGIVAIMFGPNYKGPDAQPIRYGWEYARRPMTRGSYRGQIPITRHHGPAWLGFAYDPNQLISVSSPEGKAVYYSSYRIYLPHWFVAIFLSIPATSWLLLRIRHAMRTKDGYCAGCGYDLRASPERCPECGTIPPTMKPE